MQSPNTRQNPSSSHQSLKFLTVLAFVALGALVAPGCATVGFYGQAVRGHLEITFKRRPIDRLLADDDTPAALRERLATVQAIRRFALAELGLPDSGSYTDFAELDRDVTLWLLTAAPRFSLDPKRWCYPIAGCVSYRGYFRRAAAERAAARLAGDGLETALSPAVAYSTLGWMDDPVLDTMLAYDDLQLAGLLFHELAHEVVYVPGDAGFNESFASAVEKLGRERFAAARGLARDPAAEVRRQAREAEFTALLLEARGALQTLYASDLEEPAMAAGKARVLADLEHRFQVLRRAWDGYPGYDHWFEDGPPNNARLALVATYELQVPAFEALFRESGGDFPAFYAAVERLAALPENERRARLAALAPP